MRGRPPKKKSKMMRKVRGGAKGDKVLHMPDFRAGVKEQSTQHKSWKKDIKSAIKNGEHKAASTAIKVLNRSRAALDKIMEHVERHADKKRPK